MAGMYSRSSVALGSPVALFTLLGPELEDEIPQLPRTLPPINRVRIVRDQVRMDTSGPGVTVTWMVVVSDS